MVKKVVWLLLSTLIVVALALASCQPAAEEAKEGETVVGKVVEKEAEVTEEEEEEEAAAVEEQEMVQDSLGRLVAKPRYGGYLNIAVSADPSVFDQRFRAGYYCWTMDATNDQLIIADWAKGNSGTGEVDLTETTFPEAEMALRGQIAESWEFPDPQTMVYHIRKGVRFQDKPPANGRELTAEDVAFTLKRMVEPPTSFHVNMPFGDIWEITTPDKYTVVVKWPDFEAIRFVQVSYYPYIIAPESVADDPEALGNWENALGTGPFLLTDFVPGSGLTLEKSANYWDYDPFHPQNKLPYVDGINVNIIADYTTRVAALRTGKIDMLPVTWDQLESLNQTNPELLKARRVNMSRMLRFRADQPPFEDERVRKALNMAVDRQAIVDDYYGGHGSVLELWLPSTYASSYTPMEELPDSVREIYEYNPDKAKQLLAEAGYPNGFKTDVICTSSYADLLSLVKNYLDAIGVDMEIRVLESGTMNATYYGKTWFGMAAGGHLQSHPLTCLDNSIGTVSRANTGNVYDLRFDSDLAELVKTFELEERNRKSKELNVYMLSRAWVLELPGYFSYGLWYPWVKGYSGEYKMSLYAWMKPYKYLWLDQDLRQSMTGR